MLNRSVVEVAGNLSEVLVEKGIRLLPRPNTLMNELCKSIQNANVLMPVNGYQKLDGVKKDVIFASQGYTDGEGSNRVYQASEHDTYMDNYIDDMAKLVSGYLGFSRGVVNKEVHKFIERVQESVASYKHKEAEDFFEVEYYKLPQVFTGYLVSTELATYKGATVKGSPEDINLKPLEHDSTDDSSLEKYFLIGDEEEDLQIGGWVKLLTGKVRSYLFGTVNEYGLSLPDLLDYQLVNYLFYRNLAANGELNTGDSLAALRRKASFNRDYYGAKLLVSVENYKAQIRTGRVLTTSSSLSFSYFNETGVKLGIYEESFAKIAEAGYGIELVLGYVASGDSTVSVTAGELIAAADKYLGIWAKTRSLYVIHLNNKRLDIFKHLVRCAIEESIAPSNRTEAEEGFCANTSFDEETRRLCNEYIDQLEQKDIDNLQIIALTLIAKIRFRFSNAYELLSRMNELLSHDSTIEPMEAALYSVVDYLTDYMLDQCDVAQ